MVFQFIDHVSIRSLFSYLVFTLNVALTVIEWDMGPLQLKGHHRIDTQPPFKSNHYLILNRTGRLKYQSLFSFYVKRKHNTKRKRREQVRVQDLVSF